ncbi:baseplate J/gp47 family protein [Uruburuella testudinis]|uniref:Baseplate J/gp47 family protein n=1 Tax=Uruburuella testudinis TaxID=1282863 RepID=A0ABY4DUP7_9NEIS|nr:baseplate J/gp47 family protein [Uruburuella testudinis]UOO82759.1 baseplate J/gp47 family protein [Uruburuella testudinis]
MDLSNLKPEDVKVVDDDLAVILAQTIAKYESDSGKTLQPAHIERLIINTYAYREALTRQQVNEAYRQQHVRFATGLMLDLCGDDVNTPRLEASAARCTLRFTGQALRSEVDIPTGTQVAVGEIVFATIEPGRLTAARPRVDLQAVCLTSGPAGNGWSVGQINTLQGVFAADVSAVNITVPSGGAGTESDAAYRARIMLAPESYSVAGPVGAYEYWARAVSPAICAVHVGHALDEKNEEIGGTVAVTVLTKTGMPSEELLAQVKTALSAERKRPLCDTVVVRAPTEVKYTLVAELVLLTGTNALDAKTAAEQAWAAYEAAKQEQLGSDIVQLDIQTALKVAGVYDVKLTSPASRVLKPYEWAKCTSVRITTRVEQEDG